MKLRPLLALLTLPLLLIACSRPVPPAPTNSPVLQQRQSRAVAAAPSQPFDFYLLNLSWSPEFCLTHPSARECAQHPVFVLHGLWPQNTAGPYPQHCSTEPGPSDPSQFSDIYPDPGLLLHEWQTHGTCSGLTPDAFFTLARQAFHSVVIPAQLASLNHQVSMPPDAILSLFTQSNPSLPRASLALSCGNNYLTAVEVCLTKALQPTSCGAVRSCRANTVRIPPPQS